MIPAHNRSRLVVLAAKGGRGRPACGGASPRHFFFTGGFNQAFLIFFAIHLHTNIQTNKHKDIYAFFFFLLF